MQQQKHKCNHLPLIEALQQECAAKDQAIEKAHWIISTLKQQNNNLSGKCNDENQSQCSTARSSNKHRRQKSDIYQTIKTYKDHLNELITYEDYIEGLISNEAYLQSNHLSNNSVFSLIEIVYQKDTEYDNLASTFQQVMNYNSQLISDINELQNILDSTIAQNKQLKSIISSKKQQHNENIEEIITYMNDVLSNIVNKTMYQWQDFIQKVSILHPIANKNEAIQQLSSQNVDFVTKYTMVSSQLTSIANVVGCKSLQFEDILQQIQKVIRDSENYNSLLHQNAYLQEQLALIQGQNQVLSQQNNEFQSVFKELKEDHEKSISLLDLSLNDLSQLETNNELLLKQNKELKKLVEQQQSQQSISQFTKLQQNYKDMYNCLTDQFQSQIDSFKRLGRLKKPINNLQLSEILLNCIGSIEQIINGIFKSAIYILEHYNTSKYDIKHFNEMNAQYRQLKTSIMNFQQDSFSYEI